MASRNSLSSWEEAITRLLAGEPDAAEANGGPAVAPARLRITNIPDDPQP